MEVNNSLGGSGGEDRAVRIWSLTSGRLLHTQTGFSSPTTSVCWPASLRKFPFCTIIKEFNQLLDSCHLALTLNYFLYLLCHWFQNLDCKWAP
jgi:hypothetical protein